jgi:hypothetical protein
MRWRHLLHLLWIPLAFSLALAALYFLAYTPRGLAIVVGQFNGQLGPVRVQVQGATGTLARGVHIEHLIIDHRRAHIELDDVAGRVSMLPLAWQTVRVPQLRVAHLLVHALPDPTVRPPQAPHFLPPLTQVLLNHIVIDQWQLITTNDVELDASEVRTVGVVYPDLIRLYDARLTYRAVHLRAGGELLASAPLGLNGNVHLD